MNTTLTIRNLGEDVKRKLRLQAASRQRSMEAEAREILTRAVNQDEVSAEQRLKNVQAVIGRWKGRGFTEELMALTRGEN